MHPFEDTLVKSSEVKRAMNISLPVVALESTVLTHGLPRPHNLQLAHDMERTIREQGATPATIGFLDGYLHIGLSEAELDRLANEREAYKVGPRDFATVAVREASGGTTVAGTSDAQQFSVRSVSAFVPRLKLSVYAASWCHNT